MVGQRGLAHPLGGAVQVAGDDVPADPPLGEVIQRRHAPGERIRVFIGQRAGNAEAQMLRGIGHCRHHHQRVVDRHLNGLFQRHVRPAAIDIVDAEHVGHEQRIELAAFQQLRQVYPVVETIIGIGAVARVGPQSWRLVDDTVHVESVQADLLGHQAR